MGYLYAALSSVFFSLYVVPKKLIKIDSHKFAVILGICYFVLSVIMYVVMYFGFGQKENLFDPILLLSILGAVFWKLGLDISLWAIDKIGLSQTSIYKDLQGPIGCMLILFILSEFPINKALLLTGIILLYFVSAILFTLKDQTQKGNDIKAILMVILCAIFSAISAFVRKYVTLKGYVYSQQVYASITVLILSIIFYLYKHKTLHSVFNNKKEVSHCTIGGILYFLATTTMILSYSYIAGSVAFSIISLHAILTALYGIFIFKEFSFRQNWLRILCGFVCVLVGTVLLVFV